MVGRVRPWFDRVCVSGWHRLALPRARRPSLRDAQQFRSRRLSPPCIIAAVSPRNGLLAWRIRQKLTDEEKGQRVTVRWFVEFIAFLLHLVPPTKQHFIADNSNQLSSRDVNAMLQSANSPHEFHLLSRYSPDFNPIEHCFNVWKADVKTTENMDEVKLRRKMAVYATKLSPTLVRHCYEHCCRPSLSARDPRRRFLNCLLVKIEPIQCYHKFLHYQQRQQQQQHAMMMNAPFQGSFGIARAPLVSPQLDSPTC
jgi:transposase